MTMWFLARGLGMVALAAFTIAVALGATSSDRTVSDSNGVYDEDARAATIDRRVLLQLLHRSAAVVGLVALFMHLTLILLDTHVAVSVLGALIPFTAGYRPLALGLGTLAVFAFLTTMLSGFARGRFVTSPRATSRWRTIHRAAYVGWVLAMSHGIFAGTDTRTTWAIGIYVVCALVVGLAAWTRLGRADRRSQHPLIRARSRAQSPLSLQGRRS